VTGAAADEKSVGNDSESHCGFKLRGGGPGDGAKVVAVVLNGKPIFKLETRADFLPPLQVGRGGEESARAGPISGPAVNFWPAKNSGITMVRITMVILHEIRDGHWQSRPKLEKSI
jgi:hypothetical protein